MAEVQGAPLSDQTNVNSFRSGVNHETILNFLTERLNELARGEAVPRIVILKGASGIGKTRIIRELYKRQQEVEAARRESESQNGNARPGFWPELHEESAGTELSLDPMAARKALGPRMSSILWEKKSLPTFGWWAIDCARAGDSRQLDMLSELQPTLDTLHLPLKLAVRDADGTLKTILNHVKDGTTQLVRRELSEYGTDILAAGLTAMGVPLAGKVLNVLADLAKAGSSEFKGYRAVSEDIQLSDRDTRRSAAALIAQRVLDVSHKRVPSIVPIEDLHEMDDSMGAFLQILGKFAPNNPILVVGTVWPESLDKPAFAKWFDSLSPDIDVTVLDVQRLDEKALLGLLKDYAPKTRPDVAERIVRRFPNPMDLKIFLSLEATRRRVLSEDGGPEALDYTERQFQSLPVTSPDLRLSQWNELPSAVQNALMFAAAGLQMSDDQGADFGRTIVENAASHTGLGDDDLVAGFVQADECAWSVPALGLQGWDRFTDPAYISVAVTQFKKRHYDMDDELREAFVRELRLWIDKATAGSLPLNPNDGESTQVAVWLKRLEAPLGSSSADIFASVQLACALGSASDYEGARRTLPPAWDQFCDPTAIQTFAILHKVASWPENGRERAAAYVKLMKSETDALEVERETEPQVRRRTQLLQTRHMHAFETGLLNEWATSAALFEQIMLERLELLGPENRETLAAMRQCAYAYDYAQNRPKSIEIGELYLASATTAYGPDDVDALEAAAELANTIEKHARDSGDRNHFYKRCMELCTQAIDGYARIDRQDESNRGGAFHTRGLVLHNSRYSEFDYRASCEDFREALNIARKLHDRENVLGNLTCLALTLGLAKDEDESLRVVDVLVAETGMGSVGATTERYLAALNLRGQILGHFGRRPESLRQYGELVSEADALGETNWAAKTRAVLAGLKA